MPDLYDLLSEAIDRETAAIELFHTQPKPKFNGITEDEAEDHEYQ